MKKRDERTSARVAKIAGRVLALTIDPASFGSIGNDGSFGWIDGNRKWHEFKWSDIRALAASCLTQAPDRFGFSHWGSPPGEKPGPRRPVHRVEFSDAKPTTTKRKNGVVKKGRFFSRKRSIVKKKNRAK